MFCYFIEELPTPVTTSNSSKSREGEDPVVLMYEPETQDTTYLWVRVFSWWPIHVFMISLLKPTLPQISVLDFMEKYRNKKGKVPTPGNIKLKMEIRHEKLIIS